MRLAYSRANPLSENNPMNDWQKKGRSLVDWELRPYERNRCAEHGVTGNSALGKECARPTGGSHALTTDASEQRFNGVNLRGTLEVG